MMTEADKSRHVKHAAAGRRLAAGKKASAEAASKELSKLWGLEK